MPPDTTDDATGTVREFLTSLTPRTADCVLVAPPTGTDPVMVRTVLAAARRVLADTGTAWIYTTDRTHDGTLTGTPWRIAFALQDDGWLLRNAITITSGSIYATLFLFAKARRYHFDLDAIRVPSTNTRPASRRVRGTGTGYKANTIRTPHDVPTRLCADVAPRPRSNNPGDVWRTAAGPAALAKHIPDDVVERVLRAACPPGGLVLDPYSDAAIAAATQRLDRRYAAPARPTGDVR